MMAQYILTCEHEASECEAIEREFQDLGTPEVMKGRDFFCSCPFGHHGGWVTLESESADAVLAALPPLLRSHAQVFEVATVVF